MSKPCLLWTGAIGRGGYGHRRIRGRDIQTHRLAWEEAFGPIPDGALVCHHSCGTTKARAIQAFIAEGHHA
jgi:hypothetical protein